MTEPMLFGFPITLLFLYFMVYGFLGWVMETTYCSIRERRFVARGFLYGPICPIYGVGVLMMICWFDPFKYNPILFYLVATVCMSAWEYFVGWFLEVTTHIKYWDYSRYPFQLHGRICLQVCLTWGALAYLVIFWIHPFVAGLLAPVTPLARHISAAVLMAVLLADAAATIRELALVSRVMRKMNETGEELRLQLALGRAELSDRLDDAKDTLSDKLDDAKEALGDKLGDAKEALGDKLDDAKEALGDKLGGAKTAIGDTLLAARATGEKAERLRARYDELAAKAELYSRHLRHSYSHMSSKSLSGALSDVAEASRKRKADRDAQKRAKKNK